jgi:hypothetical protein
VTRTKHETLREVIDSRHAHNVVVRDAGAYQMVHSHCFGLLHYRYITFNCFFPSCHLPSFHQPSKDLELRLGKDYLVVENLWFPDLTYFVSVARYMEGMGEDIHHGHPELVLGENLPCDLLESDVGI